MAGTREREGYAFDNESRHAQRHHGALAALLDPISRAILLDLLGDALHGAECLDVGTGGASLALWLAEQVGEHGHVTATDLHPVNIPVHPRLTVLQHDIADEPLPGGPYDLITARAALSHITARREVLTTLAAGLKPGGTLLTEDFDPLPGSRMVARAPSPGARDLMARFLDANRAAIAEHGGAGGWALDAYEAMVDEGLEDVESVVHGVTWPGGSPGCELLAAGIGQIHHELLEQGMTSTELDRVRDFLVDRRLVLHGFRVVSTSGRKPLAAAC